MSTPIYDALVAEWSTRTVRLLDDGGRPVGQTSVSGFGVHEVVVTVERPALVTGVESVRPDGSSDRGVLERHYPVSRGDTVRVVVYVP